MAGLYGYTHDEPVLPFSPSTLLDTSDAPPTSPVSLAGPALAASPSRASPAAPIHGSAGYQRARKLEAYPQRAVEANTIKMQSRQNFRTYHGLPAEALAQDVVPVTDVASICQVIEKQRIEQALPPLLGVSHVIERCPPIFRTLARGGRLEPLIERSILQPSTWDTSREGRPKLRPREALRPNPSGKNVVSFYIREWTPPAGVEVAAVLSQFEQDFPLQHFFVADTRGRAQVVRYVGLCVERGANEGGDRGRRWRRLSTDSTHRVHGDASADRAVEDV